MSYLQSDLLNYQVTFMPCLLDGVFKMQFSVSGG